MQRVGYRSLLAFRKRISELLFSARAARTVSRPEQSLGPPLPGADFESRPLRGVRSLIKSTTSPSMVWAEPYIHT